jgi:hypothetical protein
MFPPADTKSASATATLVREKFFAMFPGAQPKLLTPIFRDVEQLFNGGHPDYSAIDIRYHDLEHTLQATVCLALLFEGYQAANGPGALTARHFELGMAGVLLHDAGYLKLRSDRSGTGAKYTFCHVLRSCAFAASYLPTLGVDETEIAGVLGAISCTGPSKEISRLYFRDPVERFVGCALASADYLGQMAAADYPDELEILYGEFLESDDFVHVPEEKRLFKSARDLAERTPKFWTHVVRPKLDRDFGGVCHFLARPYPHGPNPYVEAVEKNIALIGRRVAETAPAVS